MSKFAIMMNHLKSISIPPHTSFHALQRFSILSEMVYPQYITWNRITWEPRPNKKRNLAVWYILSFCTALVALNSFFMLFEQLVSYRKDPDINLTSGILLVLVFAAYSISTAVSLTLVLHAKELCYLFKSLLKMEKILNFDHGKIFEISLISQFFYSTHFGSSNYAHAKLLYLKEQLTLLFMQKFSNCMNDVGKIVFFAFFWSKFVLQICKNV